MMPGLIMEPDDACLYITENCNSNCVMCPMSEASRKRGRTMTDEEWEHITDRIPAGTKYITITGGEPFLEYRQLIPFLQKLNRMFPDASVLILTNGRALSISWIQELILPLITDRYCFAVPVHSCIPEVHDSITQSRNSFAQTWKGLQFLSRTRAKVEVRVVGTQLNAGGIDSLLRFLCSSDVRISIINLIAMEVTGSAARKRNSLWIDYRELFQRSKAGICFTIEHGIDVGLYNFPLCSLPREFWPISRHSITKWKIRYEDACSRCLVKDACGGLFYSVQELHLFQVDPIREVE